jgi:hypothetical protein
MPIENHGSDKQNNHTASEQNPAIAALRLELQMHKEQAAQNGLIGKALTSATEFLHGSHASGEKVEQLAENIAQQTKSGNIQAAQELARDAKAVIEADKKALERAAQISMYGTGLVQSIGLFLPGKVGYAVTAGTAALDAYKPGSNSSLSEQVADMGLAVTKATGLKASFGYAAKHNWGVASTAVGLGVLSRVSETALTRSTYLDNNGNYSARLGAERTLEASTNTSALASEVGSLIIARGVLGKMKLSGGPATDNKMFALVATGGVFGASKGSTDEIIRQSKAGVFEPGQFATHVLASAATNMVGAAIGGRYARLGQPKEAQALAPQSKPIADATSELPKQLEAHNYALTRNFPGSTAREYQIVGSKVPIAEMMTNSSQAAALTRVREVKADGQLGPIQRLLVQHTDNSTTISSALAAKADLIATCNPKALPLDLQGKHIIPSSQSLWLTQESGGRLRFSDFLPTGLKPDQLAPVKLGPKTVSELLLGPETPKHFEDTHDKVAMAKAMRHFKTPARYFNGGADSIAFELPDRSILKITDRGWDPSWGSREIWTKDGMRRIDAPILQKPQTIDLPEALVTYFVQKRLISPVAAKDVKLFDALIEKDAKFKFWDNDFKAHGRNQLGYDEKTRQLFLIDYDAVRLPHLVPEQARGGGTSWFPRRYDVSPF